MNKDYLNSISEAVGEFFDALEQRANKEVVKQLTALNHVSNKSEWKRKQFNAVNTLKKNITKSISPLTNKTVTSLKNAVKLTLVTSVKGDNIKENEDEKKKVIVKETSKLIDFVSHNIPILISSSTTLFKQSVNNIFKATPPSGGHGNAKVTTLGLEKLREEIDKVVNGIGVENAPKVSYKEKGTGRVIRHVNWRSWMEMNVRTTLSQTATDYQYQVSRSNGIIFYLCNYFSDCALDHAPYQGRIYYDKSMLNSIKDVEEKKQVLEYIKQHKCLDIKEVMENKPYLTTRPNCRHRFKPMLTQDVLTTSVKRMLVDNKMTSGHYDKVKYENLQEQRLNERTIRKYKERLDNNQVAYDNAKSLEQKALIEKQMTKNKQLITKWQKKNNKLVKANPYLERDYRRESYKILVKDLGVRYNTRK